MSDTVSQLIVGSEFNVGLYAPTRTVPLTLQGWEIQSLSRDPRGSLWCVGRAGNPARWESSMQSWVSAPHWLGGWSLRSLAWDSLGNLWCVGSAGNISRWVGGAVDSGEWAGSQAAFPQLTAAGGWRMVTFSPQGIMWGVRQEGSIVKWSAGLMQWQQVGAPPGGALMVSLSDSALYAVSEDFRTYSTSAAHPQHWTEVPIGWRVRWYGPQNTGGITVPPSE